MEKFLVGVAFGVFVAAVLFVFFGNDVKSVEQRLMEELQHAYGGAAVDAAAVEAYLDQLKSRVKAMLAAVEKKL